MCSARKPGLPLTAVELKLALPYTDWQQLEYLVAHLPLLALRNATRERLYNTYYDTSEDMLNHRCISLRIRRVGNATSPLWLQTLKVGGVDNSALSQRGEWEVVVTGAALELSALQATPWIQVDPDGDVFRRLTARFTTDFTRTRWTVQDQDGGEVGIALDLGEIVAGQHSTPICELELELKNGHPSSLFEIARQIARVVILMPLRGSKTQRGFSLARNTLDQPLLAQPPTLTFNMTIPEAAISVLQEMFSHFSTNLHTLLTSNDPEVVHQARVGWRRFKTALAIFKKTPLLQVVPNIEALKPALRALGRLRDLDVAHSQTLPMLANAYVSGSPKRKMHWMTLHGALANTVTSQRLLVRNLLNNQGVGCALLSLTEWLKSNNINTADGIIEMDMTKPLRPWSRRCMARLYDQLKVTMKNTPKSDNLHRTRILAKRLRYGVEALQTVLPKRSAQQWCRRAARLQSSIGKKRDLGQALHIAKRLHAHPRLLTYLQEESVRRIYTR